MPQVDAWLFYTITDGGIYLREDAFEADADLILGTPATSEPIVRAAVHPLLLHRPRLRGTTPPYAIRVNWKHPLARGLVFCAIYAERSGVTVRDLVEPASTGTISGPLWANGLWKIGVNVPGTSGNHIDFGNPTKCQFAHTDSFSIFSVFDVRGGAGAARTILSKDTGIGSRTLWQWRLSTANKMECFVGSAGGTLGTITGTATIAADAAPHSGAFVRDVIQDKLFLYLDGLEDANGADGSTGSWQITEGTIATHVANTVWMNGLKVADLIYNRPLDPAEVAALHRDPFQMLEWGPPVIGGGRAETRNIVFTLPVEWAGPQQIAETIPAEWAATASTTSAVPVDWLAIVREQGVIPAETLAALRSVDKIPVEWGSLVVHIAASDKVPVEWMQALRRVDLTPWESGAFLVLDDTVPIEVLLHLDATDTAPVDWLQTLRSTDLAPWESSGVIVLHSDLPIPVEWLQHLVSRLLAPVEAAGQSTFRITHRWSVKRFLRETVVHTWIVLVQPLLHAKVRHVWDVRALGHATVRHSWDVASGDIFDLFSSGRTTPGTDGPVSTGGTPGVSTQLPSEDVLLPIGEVEIP